MNKVKNAGYKSEKKGAFKNNKTFRQFQNEKTKDKQPHAKLLSSDCKKWQEEREGINVEEVGAFIFCTFTPL